MEKKYYALIHLTNSDNHNRKNEPVITKLNFSEQDVHKDSLKLFNEENESIPFQLIDVIENDNGNIVEASIVYLVSMKKNELTKTFKLTFSNEAENNMVDFEGITILKNVQDDGFRRLDTGHYILELCKGTADGTSYGKWGIRYFEAKEEGLNLIKDYSNAIGGFYGPFFTPKNGLINPPEHTVVNITVEEEGPIYCRYRFDGQVPDGLDPNLKGKKFNIIWEFFYGTPTFRRQYNVDEFSTIVDGSPVVNKITVGDEFESGQGNRVFDKWASYGQTLYREGDPYAKILYDGVYKLLDEATEETYPNIKQYRDSIGDELNDVSWDYFWRLFCVKEGILTDDEIKKHISEIIPEAHKVVYETERFKDIKITNELVDVNASPEQTIFPINTNKTAEINSNTGYKMVWYTSNVVPHYQIVQRNDSGWVNWGTNGENEYPELPVGSIIYSGYGKIDNWEEYADTLEKNIYSKQGKISEE